MTNFKDDITIKGNVTAELDLIVDNAASTAEVSLGFFTDYTTVSGYGIRQDGASGFFLFMPNANNPQILIGNESSTGTTFIDCDNNRPLNINTLDTGVGSPGLVTIGEGGLAIAAGGNITLGASNTVDGVDVSSPINSIEVSSNAYQLLNDTASPGNNFVYGTNDSGTKGWYPASQGVGASIPGIWKFDNSTSPGPSSGEFRLNNGTLASVTQLFIHEESENGTDFATIFGALGSGNKIYIQELEDSTAFILLSINGVGTDNGTDWTFDVAVDDSGNLFDDGKECSFIFFGAMESAPEDLAVISYNRTTLFNITSAGVPEYVPLPNQLIENNTSILEKDGVDDTRFNVKETGVYGIAKNIIHDASGGNIVTSRIILNGTTTVAGTEFSTNPPNNGAAVTPWVPVSLTAGDFLQLEVEVNALTGEVREGSGIAIIRLSGSKGAKGDTGSGSSINIENNGTPLAGGPFDTLNFLNSNASDGGSATADLDIGNVNAGAAIADNVILRGDGGASGVQGSIWNIADDGFLTESVNRVGFVADFSNALTTGGGNGILISAGEQLGDIALRVTDSDASFTIIDVEADQGSVVIGKTYAQNIIDNGVSFGVDLQNATANFQDFNTQTGNYRIGGTIVPITQYLYTADMFQSPISDFAVNDFASVGNDTNNAGLRVRRFDSTTDEGVGVTVAVPPNANAILFKFVSRAETTPAGAVTAAIDFYERQITGTPTAWSAAIALNDIDLGTNEDWVADEQGLGLGTLGLTAGETYQFEFVRDGGTLVGDWTLLTLEIQFT